MLKLGEEAKAKNLKVGVGLMCRHCPARGEMFKKIQDGMIGDITLLRAYRQHNPVAFFESAPKPAGITELLYQVQRFHSFLWASGGCYSDFYIHNIDECCWMKNAWPVEASGSGGRHYRGNSIDQNFDSYSVEYTFGDGTKLLLEGRCMTGCDQQFASLRARHQRLGDHLVQQPLAVALPAAQEPAQQQRPGRAEEVSEGHHLEMREGA